MRVRDMIEAAVRQLQGSMPNGVETYEIYGYLDQHHPRPDGRPWKGNMAIPGDHAVWADNGEATNPSAADDPAYPKFLVRVSSRSERAHRYRMRS